MSRHILYWLFLISMTSFSQTRLRKFSNVVNHPAINVFAPYISADNRSLIYLSDDAKDNALTLFYTKKIDGVNWEKPISIPKNIINSRLAFPWGFALEGARGQTLYFTSLKDGGLGGFDIYFSKKQGDSWALPVNVGMPINSLAHEGAPSVSIDGSTLYFMRCQHMTRAGAEGCHLLIAKKSRTGKWREPVSMPDYINTGNSQAPRILADGETLIFSSDQLPDNKGKMDLYLTQFDGAEWSQPVPLSFANTEHNDQYVSASALGRYLLKDQPGRNTNEIVELLFPQSLKPKTCMKIEGVVDGPSNLSSYYIHVFDRGKNEQVYNSSPDEEGRFVLYLKEGGYYDFAIEPAKGGYTFYSKIYDLTEKARAKSPSIAAKIVPVTANIKLPLAGIMFEPHTSRITPGSSQELRRLLRIVKANKNFNFNIEVAFNGYRRDSIASNVDLTEQELDTVHISIIKNILIPEETDSTKAQDEPTLEEKDDLLSEQPAITQDSEDDVTSITVDSVVVKTIYHNDRTVAQANAIIDYLIKKGISSDRLTPSHIISEEATLAEQPGKTKVSIKVLE